VTDLRLAFGCNKALPDGVTAAWGARFIYPDDLVWNRQDLKGENTDPLKDWLNAGALGEARRAARLKAPDGTTDETVVLYEDDTGIVVANPQASYGYLYVAAWLKADINPKGEAHDDGPDLDAASD